MRPAASLESVTDTATDTVTRLNDRLNGRLNDRLNGRLNGRLNDRSNDRLNDSVKNRLNALRAVVSSCVSCCFFIGVLAVAPVASGQASEPEPFAGLTVTPAGGEVFDISTGMTTLPDGGEVVDAATDIRLVAPFIRMQEGAWLEARAPVVQGKFGELSATELAFDLDSLVLEAEGPLRLVREGLVLEAQRARYIGDEELVAFTDPTSEGAGFSAAQILLDPNTGHALLVGPYRYEDGLFTLSSDEPGALLALTWSVVDDVGGYDASTDIPEGLLTRFAPLLDAPAD